MRGLHGVAVAQKGGAGSQTRWAVVLRGAVGAGAIWGSCGEVVRCGRVASGPASKAKTKRAPRAGERPQWALGVSSVSGRVGDDASAVRRGSSAWGGARNAGVRWWWCGRDLQYEAAVAGLARGAPIRFEWLDGVICRALAAHLCDHKISSRQGTFDGMSRSLLWLRDCDAPAASRFTGACQYPLLRRGRVTLAEFGHLGLASR